MSIWHRKNAHGFSRTSHRPGSGAALRVSGAEGWRGIACLLVVTYHVWQNMDPTGDGIGPWADHASVLTFFLNIDTVVDLFFVLSGLLLFLPFANAALHDQVAVPNRRSFLYRRVLRLYPLYFVVVMIAWFSRNYGVATAQWRDLFEHLLLLQSLDSKRIFYTVGPAWTLSVEWVFYLALTLLGPLAVHWVRRRTASRDRRAAMLLGAFALVALASLLYSANVELVWHEPVTSWAWRFGPAAKGADFALGMSLAVAMAWLGERRLPTWAFPAIAGGGIALIYLVRLQGGRVASPDHLVVRHPVIALGWSLVLLGVMSCRSSIPARVVDNKILVRLGILTFSIYLVHEPVLLLMTRMGLFHLEARWFWINLALVTSVTLAVAWVGHRLVEEPWVDAGALQARGGGRKELYPGVVLEAADAVPTLVPAPTQASGPAAPQSARTGSLREQVLTRAASTHQVAS